MPVTVHPPQASSWQARGTDVSVKGMSITADQQLRPQTDCKVVFALVVNGQPARFELGARVVYSFCKADVGWTMGLEFKGVSAEQAALLDAYIRAR